MGFHFWLLFFALCIALFGGVGLLARWAWMNQRRTDFLNGASFCLALVLIFDNLTNPGHSSDGLFGYIFRYVIAAYIIYNAVTSMRKRFDAQSADGVTHGSDV